MQGDDFFFSHQLESKLFINAEAFDLSLSHNQPFTFSSFPFFLSFIFFLILTLSGQSETSTPGLPRLNSGYCSTGSLSPEGDMQPCSDAVEHSN